MTRRGLILLPKPLPWHFCLLPPLLLLQLCPLHGHQRCCALHLQFALQSLLDSYGTHYVSTMYWGGIGE